MIEPLRHNPQTQPITVALKNICRDYPAGGGVLRELLQNADDAGASSVSFVLDQTNYPADKLVDPKLAEHQGPSLLAYNDAIFSDRDFDSLSRIGDSGKLLDGSTTGRFGRGFNAVYNWTDSPSIVSRNGLLILDPHHRWTGRFQNPGGPVYDFVKNAAGGDMEDQMAAFSSITKDFDQAFQGTIIRIPLRTPAQALESKICSRAAPFSEVAEVLETFADDFGHTGLLFMKNVSQISITVGDKPPRHIGISNIEEVKRHKSEINAVIKKTIREGQSNFSRSFQVEIASGLSGKEQMYRFAVHHSIQNYPEDESLKSWSRDEALVPWVAVASEIDARAGEEIGGSLFNVLPSQICINQPIYIHSCFSMSPDRARLHRIGDSSVQYPLSGRWNHWLFDELIPAAWADLLVYLAKQYPNKPAFEIWPRTQGDSNDISYHTNEKVLQIIQQKNYRVWYTDLGYVTMDSGLVAKTEDSLVMRKALNEAGVHVIYLPSFLFSLVEATCRVEHLKPKTLCARLGRGQEQLRRITEDAKQALLDYVISDSSFCGYGAVELFPFEDGTYRAINNEISFIHRDENERLLFRLEPARNIDTQKLSSATLQIFRKGCTTASVHASLRQRSPQDLKSYCLNTHFDKIDLNEDLISVDEEKSTFISKVWDWIATRQYSILDSNISCLWLLPLTNGRYRKIKPTHASSITIYAATGELGDFLRSFAKIAATSNKPILRADTLSARTLKLITVALKNDPSLLVWSSDSIEDFMLWLGKTREVFDQVTDNDKWRLHKLLASRLHAFRYPSAVSVTLRGLKMFQKIVWRAKNDVMVPHQTWISLEGHSSIVGLREISPVPDIGEVIFLNAKTDDTMRVLRYFRLAECPSSLELLERFMIPSWQDEKMLRIWTRSGKEKLTESILRDFYKLSPESRNKVSASAMIPVKRFDGEKADKFSVAKSLINPSEKGLRELYFEDEEACPVDWVLEKYIGVLINCGLRTALDGDHVVERAKCFVQRSSESGETMKRARKLLQSSPSWKEISNDHEMSTLRELRWLPVTDLHGSCTFKNAQECRGLDEKSLVGYVLPVLSFDISLDWRDRLGWSHLIPHATLLSQLECGIENGDRKVADAVLNYVDEKRQIDGVRQALMELSCVVASKGQFVSVQKTFQSGCEGLQPYLYDIDWGFWQQHKLLLKNLGVKEKPGLQDLLKIQDQFSSDVLHDRDIPVAIQIIKLASAFPECQISSLRILDGAGKLRPMKDVSYNDLGLSTITGTFNSTHPDIPKTLIRKLQIEPLSARVKKRELGIADADDDEFDQHEDVATAISDTLTRYTVESTFKEFLANADDCNKAKEVNWLLDDRLHPKDNLITDELGMLQGPALLVHNDGVFDDDDFEGLRRVGRGSKMDDVTTIGKFGRGSQTMYHWSDVPMLLSGKYLVILDPLRQVLDINYRTGRRKPGVKIELSKLKGQYRDQLAPFEGLWDFSQELDYYNGTIFRFPLRKPNDRSKLLEAGKPLDFFAARNCLDTFLGEEGRISLLFLRNIQYMDFRVYGAKEPRWSVKSDKDWSFSGWTKCTITRCMNHGLNGTVMERWRVAIEDLKKVCTELPSRHKRRMKNVECGMAAFVPMPGPKQDRIFPAAPVPKYLSTLPLPFPTDLPVHIHATFLLASDRASIPVEDSTQEDGAKWNRWLLSHAIPDLYLAFLEDLGRQSNWVHNPFVFWPQDSPSKKHLSEPVYTSFWQMLPKSSRGLFPVTQQIRAARLGERRPPELVKAEEAIFDFLPLIESKLLREVLESQVPNLVRPPKGVRRELELRMEAKSITPKRLRQLFKDENASKFLEEETSKNEAALNTILKIISPISDEDFKELDGCRILLLANHTLGTIRFKSSFDLGDHYFLADGEELELFGFASSSLIRQQDSQGFMTTIVDCGKFNITRLDLANIGTLLGRKEFGDNVPTAEKDIWLAKFWSYCLGREASHVNMNTPFTLGFHIGSYPIFKASCDGIEKYVAPNQMNLLPSVVEPDSPQQKSLCSKFPGIYVFSSNYLPTYLRTTEKSLHTRASFARFILTISKLAENTNMDAYIKRFLGPAEILLLGSLVKKFVSADLSIQDHNIKRILGSLPLWPNAGSSTSISAASAFATTDSQLTVPWMTGYQNFIEHRTFTTNSTVMRALGVTEVSGINLLLTHILPNWPTELPDINTYSTLIKAIPRISNWKNALDRLRQSRLAPNRAKQLRTASQLYDHNDVIFRAAFRDEASVTFLLGDLEESRSFWLILGLKHRVNDQFEPDDYIRCLKKMRDRLESCSDQALYSAVVDDARLVLVPLTSPSTALGRCSKGHWAAIANQATFPVMRNFSDQQLYRRETMILVATATPLLRLSEIIKSQYISICWSQISFPRQEPTITTMAELYSKGKPSTAMVWRHVEHMAGSVGSVVQEEVAAFLSDLYNSYDYLQENLDDSSVSFTVLRTRQVWFNLELTDTKLVSKSQLESCRCGIENLILESSCDTTNLKLVKQGLIRYQKLLRALGCKSIVYPLVEEPEKRTKELVSTSLSRLRQERKLLDVTLEAKSGSIRAHRVVIAAASSYFATQFNGNWSNNETISLKQYSHSILSTAVDFSYSDADTYDWKSMQLQDDDRENLEVIADKLDDWLELLEAADYLGMPDLKAQVEHQILFLPKVFIREHNVLGVLKRASDANAALVERYCSKFYAENKRAVDLAVEE